MERFDEADFDAALALIRSCDRAVDLPDFRRRVLGVADLMPANAVAYNEADRITGVVTAEVRPEWMYEPHWRGVFAAYSHQHPLIAHISATGDLCPITISDLVSEADWHATDLYKEFFAPLDVEDQIAFGLPSSPRMVLGVSLNRPSRGFSARERSLLTLIAPHLGDAYLAARARSVVAAGAETASHGEHLIVLDENDLVTALVGAPSSLLGAAGASIATGEPLPRELTQRTRPDSAEDVPPRGRSAFSLAVDGERINVRSFDGAFPAAARILEISPEREAVSPELAAELQISSREAEVANLLAHGLSDQLIAEQLWISPHTVKRHLERIYAKLEVGSRSAAIVRLLGAN